jgi:hypothetical protein
MSGDRWYNSDFGRRAGLGVLIVGCGLFISSCMEGCGKWDAATIRAEAQAEASRAETLHTGDLDGNGAPDKFYIVSGQIAPVEMNGKPVMSYFSRGTNQNYALGRFNVEVSER